jgi:hypothetical protein
LDLGSCLNSSGTIPTIPLKGSAGIRCIITQERASDFGPHPQRFKPTAEV